MKRLVLVGLAFLSLAAAAPAERVVVKVEPPPLVHEWVPPAPSPVHVWVPGRWHWGGERYAWVSGTYVPTPGHEWVPGHWDKGPDGWFWVEGHWRTL
ncbi:MAG: YXWGXW repeat-containing protein [Armatimonadetes bacterium]|nr:YXWGXW repeat-containing protein [Armatimonadota bacterium]